MKEGDTFLNSTIIESHGVKAVLERVLNADGFKYSLIIRNGEEKFSAPTADEKGLLKFWEKEGWKI